MGRKKLKHFRELQRLNNLSPSSKKSNSQELIERMKEDFPDRKMKVAKKGELKMSEILWDFAAPYRDLLDDLDSHYKFFTLAILAWNLALLPEEKRKNMMSDVILKSNFNDDLLAQQEFKNSLNELISRKLKYFAEYDRFIQDFDLEDKGSKIHLSVASVIHDKEE